VKTDIQTMTHPSRRDFLTAAAALSASALIASVSRAAKHPPNIVLIMADDMAMNALAATAARPTARLFSINSPKPAPASPNATAIPSAPRPASPS
jgi:uncharacterized protein (DUF1501 family)